MLGASGLVQVRPHRAAVVAKPGHEHLIGMFEAMAELESLCAGHAAERMTSIERRGLEEIHERLRMPDPGGRSPALSRDERSLSRLHLRGRPQ